MEFLKGIKKFKSCGNIFVGNNVFMRDRQCRKEVVYDHKYQSFA